MIQLEFFIGCLMHNNQSELAPSLNNYFQMANGKIWFNSYKLALKKILIRYKCELKLIHNEHCSTLYNWYLKKY